MHTILLAGVIALLACQSVCAQGTRPLFWSLQDDQAFGSRHTLNAPNGESIVLPGRSLVALAEAKRRIGQQYGLQPVLVLTNRPGINAFATEANGQSIVAVHIDTILAIKDDEDMWAALIGHEFGHVYRQHVANHQTRAALIELAALVLDVYQQKHGRQRTELIKTGAQLIDNAFTRDQEREADADSVTYMTRAGYNPEGAIRLQQLLMSHYGSAGAMAFLQSHPSGEERISNLQAKIAETPMPVADTTAVSSMEIKRYLTLCGAETTDAKVESNKVTLSQYSCLKRQNPEIAKRFALCVNDLAATNRLNRDALENCMAYAEPTVKRFGYLPWRSYCGLDARNDGAIESVTTAKYNQCLWSNAPTLTMRGYLCEEEATQTRVPAENKVAAVRACSSEATPLATRFDATLWSLACKRKSMTTSDPGGDRTRIEQACRADGPADATPVAESSHSPLTAQEILAEVKASWHKSTVPAGPWTECDKLANTTPLGDLPRHALGYIDTTAAEPACLAAAKSPKDAGARAMLNLAMMAMQQGKFADAERWATKAKARNATGAGSTLATFALLSLGGHTIDYAKGYALLREEAKRGNPEAAVDFAGLIRAGRGLEAQPEIAVELSQMAADRGYVPGVVLLANMHSTGRGVPQNKTEALRLLRQAIAADYPPAYLPLIALLRESPDAQDKAEVQAAQSRILELAQRYAAMGSLSAKSTLATMYANGVGVPVDRVKAVELNRELAQFDLVPALMALGFAYLNGAGVVQDKAQAITYFQRAAALGSKDADIQLARARAR